MSIRLLLRRTFATMAESPSKTPLEDTIRSKLTTALCPRTLEIYNDSHKHAHHKPMAGVTSKETHFRLVITSDAFEKKASLARHRLVNGILKEELEREGGIHALQLKTMTVAEEEKQLVKAKGEDEEGNAKDGS